LIFSGDGITITPVMLLKRYTGNKLFSNQALVRLLVPLLVEQLLVMLVGMLDTVMVSSAGEAAISGVSIVNDVNNLAISVLSALAGGGAVVVSQYLGNGDRDNSNRSASQLVMIAGVISSAIAVFCLLFHKNILHLLYSSVEEDVMNAAVTYFFITAMSFPFLGIYNAGAAVFRSMNRTKSTMVVSMIMNAINLVGNYIGVYLLHMGVAGVAWPTLISRMVAAVLMTAMAFSRENPLYLEVKEIFAWHRDMVRKILSIAVPNGTENGLFQLGKILVSAIVATFGTAQIAANGVTNSLATLCYTSEMAVQLAIVTVVGRCVGAGDYEQAEYYVRKMILIAYGLAIANNLMVFLAVPYALKMYTLTAETTQIVNVILTMECIAIASLHPYAFVLPCALRASGDAKYTMYVGVASMFACRVLGAYILGSVMGLGVVGTRIAMYIDWTARIIFFVIRYRSGRWKNYRIVED